MSRPSRADRAGQVYLDLQRQAKQAGRGTQEFLVRYALERFLYRLSQTSWRNRLVLHPPVMDPGSNVCSHLELCCKNGPRAAGADGDRGRRDLRSGTHAPA